MATVYHQLTKDSTMQAINTTLGNILQTLENRSTDISAWKDAVAALSTDDKNSLKSAIYEVLGLNASAQKSVQALPDIYSILDDVSTPDNGAGIHNSLYRGKNLGSGLTSDQLARVNDGTFKGLWLGDYASKSVTTNVYVPPKDSGYAIQGDDTVTSLTVTPQMAILDHDYYRRAGDNIDLTQHHLNMGPLQNLYVAPMNKKDSSGANFTTGAYALSEMRTKYLEAAVKIFEAIFGAGHLLSYRDLLQNATKDGQASGGAWLDCKVELMDERQVYGGLVFDAAGKTAFGMPPRYTVATKQFNLFRVRPDLISNRQWYWLRNTVSSAVFASVGSDGNCCSNYAALVIGVRPAALIY